MRSRAWSRIATASAPPRSACSSRMPAARARRACRGRARRCGTAAPDPWETIAPSAIPFGEDWAAPRAMTLEDIDARPRGLRGRDRRAVRVGFDAIELHMAHGYLLHSFVSPISNRRNDEYGGDARRPHALSARGRARGARGGAEGHAARRAHHRHRLGRGRARRRRRGRVRRALKADGPRLRRRFLRRDHGGRAARDRRRASTCRSPSR